MFESLSGLHKKAVIYGGGHLHLPKELVRHCSKVKNAISTLLATWQCIAISTHQQARKYNLRTPWKHQLAVGSINNFPSSIPQSPQVTKRQINATCL